MQFRLKSSRCGIHYSKNCLLKINFNKGQAGADIVIIRVSEADMFQMYTNVVRVEHTNS